MGHDDHIQFSRFISNICRLHATRTDQLIDKIGLYRGQAITLLVLSFEDGLTHTELAERMEISPAATTKVIKRLEELKYLERRAEPTDERVSRVFLLPDGWACIEKIRDSFDMIDQVISTNISVQEQEVLRDLLVRVYNNLQSMTIDSAAGSSFPR
jgi:MarR family transcriptional regulator, organic hydroperoxide resistance regulator